METTVEYTTKRKAVRRGPASLYVHFEAEQYERIRDLSERWGCTVEGAVRRAVETAALFVRLETAG